MEEELLLEEQDRTKLDAIVSQMEANGESTEDIEFVVSDFKQKYGKPNTPSGDVPTGVDTPVSEDNGLKKKEEAEPISASISESGSSSSGSTLEEGPSDFIHNLIKDRFPKFAAWRQENFRSIKASAQETLAGVVGIPNLLNQTAFALAAPDELKEELDKYDPEVREDFINNFLVTTFPNNPAALGNISADTQEAILKEAEETRAAMEQFDTSIIKDFEEGNYTQAFKRIGTQGVGAIPSIVQAMIPGVGIPSIIGGSAANKLEEEQKEGNTEDAAVGNAWINGAADGLLEIFTKKMGKRFLDVLKKNPKEAKTVLKSALEGLGATAGEGASEAATTYIQNLSDEFVQGKDVDWDTAWQEVMDSFLIGAAVGGGMGGTTSVAEISDIMREHAQERQLTKFMTEEEKASYYATKKELNEIIDIVNDPNTPESLKEDLNNVAEKKAKEVGESEGSTMERMDSALSIISLDKQLKDAKDTFSKVKDNPDMSEGLKEEIYSRLKEKMDNIQKQKDELIGKKDTDQGTFEEIEQEGTEIIEETEGETTVSKEPVDETNIDQSTPVQEEVEESGFNYKKLLSGVPVLSYLDEQIFEKKIAKPLDKAVTKIVKKGLESPNKIIRNVSETAVSWFNGLARTDQEVADKRSLVGKQEAAFIKGREVTKGLHDLIGSDPAKAERVHRVMDPEFYQDEGSLTYDELDDSEKALHDALREINDKTHQANYDAGFIDEKTYNKYKDNYIGRGYEPYEETVKEAEKEIFVDTRIFGKIYKQRKELTDWMIDNKVKDPIYLTVNRMIRTERNMVVKQYADNVAKTLAKDEAGPGYQKMTGKQYGSLDGKYVPNYIAEDFKGYHFSNEFMDKIYQAAMAYDSNTVRQLLKRYHTVYSPVVQVGNFMSNHAFAFASGVNIVQLWKNLPSAVKEMSGKKGDYVKLLEEGIIGANILNKDLTINDQQAKELKLPKKALQRIKKLDDRAKQIYSGSDDVMKLSAYKALREVGYTHDESVQRVFEGFQNYAVVGKAWDFAAKAPLVGNAYIKFQADLMRIVKNAVTKRPMTTASFLAGIRLATLMASRYFGEDDEEREIREARPFIPKIYTPFGDIPLVVRMGNKEINLARFISPYYEYDIPGEHWLQKLTRFTPIQIKVTNPGTGEESKRVDTPDVLLGPFWQAFVTNRDFRNKPVTDPDANKYSDSGLTFRERLANQVEYVGRSIVPLWSTIDDVRKTVLYGEDYFGRDKTTLDVIISKVAKVQTWDGETTKKQVVKALESINYDAKNINTKLSTINNKFLKDVEEYKKRLDEGKITQEQFDNKYEKLYESALKRTEEQMRQLTKKQQELNDLQEKIRKSGIEL